MSGGGTSMERMGEGGGGAMLRTMPSITRPRDMGRSLTTTTVVCMVSLGWYARNVF